MAQERMKQKTSSRSRRIVRHHRVRQKISGTANRPRLCVSKSRAHFWAQIIDDVAAKTIVSGTDVSKEVREMLKGTKQESAYLLGKYIGEQAKSKGISKVVFDRGGFVYQGRIRKFAEGAREGGLIF